VLETLKRLSRDYAAGYFCQLGYHLPLVTLQPHDNIPCKDETKSAKDTLYQRHAI